MRTHILSSLPLLIACADAPSTRDADASQVADTMDAASTDDVRLETVGSETGELAGDDVAAPPDRSPEPLVEHAGATNLVVGNGRIFWTQYDEQSGRGRILACPLSGCDVEDAVELVGGLDRPVALTFDPAYLYWLTETGRLQRTGHGAVDPGVVGDVARTPVIDPEYEAPGTIVSDAGRVVWTWANVVLVTDIDQEPFTTRRYPLFDEFHLWAFHRHAGDIYVHSVDHVYVVPSEGAAPERVPGLDAPRSFVAFAAHEDQLYWRSFDEGLQTCPLTGCGADAVRTIAADDDSPLAPFLVDGGHAYWMSRDSSALVATDLVTGVASRAPTGTASTRLGLWIWAVHDRYVYYQDRDDDRIARLPK